MNKEQLINRQATKLRIKHQFYELTELECKSFVRDSINEVLTLYNISQKDEYLITLKKRFDEAMRETDLIVQQSMFYDLFNGLLPTTCLIWCVV